MKKIVIFGNCQAVQLGLILKTMLSDKVYNVEHLSNNNRTGGMKSLSRTIQVIAKSDILIYQPLNSSHGKLSEKNILSLLKSECIPISFSYIFNSGVYSLCHAPQGLTHFYGDIYGEDIIIDLLDQGYEKLEIISMYRKGEINFNLLGRFNKSLNIMREKEVNTDIKLADFIKENYQVEKLFLTHNHPVNSLFLEMIKQIKNLGKLSLINSEISHLPLLGRTNCPISPYDIQIHSYQFDEDSDWFIKGRKLINLIANEYSEKSMGSIGINLELSIGVVNSNEVSSDHILTADDINVLRDTAVELELSNLYASYRLMSIAHKKRPTGPFIKKKLREYKGIINL